MSWSNRGKRLFGLRPSQIEAVVHPQSSFIPYFQFQAVLWKPRWTAGYATTIQYALGYPARFRKSISPFLILKYLTADFRKAWSRCFRNLAIAFDAMQKGLVICLHHNAANEIQCCYPGWSIPSFVSGYYLNNNAEGSFIQHPSVATINLAIPKQEKLLLN
jgi:hypothetical protein